MIQSFSKITFDIKSSISHRLPFEIDHFLRIYSYRLFILNDGSLFGIIKILLETTKKIIKNWNKTIVFYPEFPFVKYPSYSLYRSCLLNAYRVSRKFSKNTILAIKWEDKTFLSCPRELNEMSTNGLKVLNLACKDISKSKVQEVFEKVFQYGLKIDPLIYQGKCVVKSNLNAKHDGRVLNCPIQRKLEDDVVYEKLINNVVKDKNLTIDYRVPVFGAKLIPIVYLKYYPLEKRFGGYSDMVACEVVEPENVFTENEVSKILEFCQLMECDHTELDILRDQDSGEIYIVDVNITPYALLLSNRPEASVLEPKSRSKAASKLADTFSQLFTLS
ncbi:MAG: hypothetical protein F6K63_00370 [Moorea sp. SIO1G6]|uniref:hypothetical protein n=1 Tax=Moorena sp. SIO1G6 TaxID=2607840 RepID=UPI0013BF8584|nr:hypothetical protein [Moorena sp. SIO1G6]NES83005.1 hypothetical protein [Moorena sp. SIO2B7]NET62929.1 hypothetical protein [Moorena sp. SIO1G6]